MRRQPRPGALAAAVLAVTLAAVGAVAARDAHAQGRARGDDDSAALVEDGRRALRRGAYDDAAAALDQAIALNPRRIEAYVLRAAIHAARQQYDDGVALLRRAQALAPDNLDVVAALGTQLVLGGHPDDGVPLLERAVTADPARYGAQSLLGKRYAALGRWRDAVVAYEAYLAHRPAELAGEDAIHQLGLAEAYLRSDDARRAYALYDDVLARRPDEPAARMGEAWALAAIDCRRAVPALAALADLVPRFPQILVVEGQCRLSMGDAVAALRLGERYLDQAATPLASGWGLVGEAAAATGDLERARAALGEARQLEPAHRSWTRRLARVLRRARRQRQRGGRARRARRAEPGRRRCRVVARAGRGADRGRRARRRSRPGWRRGSPRCPRIARCR
ncbi:MAG: tetratricopeptide repeat protein [Kofleriaceae bacterium]|nr:tetratricopeptide repeat protein [Kofleriaceae bacterium]